MSSLLTRFSQVHPQDCPNPKMPVGSPPNHQLARLHHHHQPGRPSRPDTSRRGGGSSRS